MCWRKSLKTRGVAGGARRTPAVGGCRIWQTRKNWQGIPQQGNMSFATFVFCCGGLVTTTNPQKIHCYLNKLKKARYTLMLCWSQILGTHASTQGKQFVCGGVVVIPLPTVPVKKEVEKKDCIDSPASHCTACKEVRQDRASLNIFLCPWTLFDKT